MWKHQTRRVKIRLFSDQCHPVNAYSLCFVDITASYWWIYYFFDGCHKKQWGELWWKWYMLMYLICICIFIRPWCNRVLIKSMMCKHSSIDYIVMHFLINVVSYFIVICLMKTSSCILEQEYDVFQQYIIRKRHIWRKKCSHVVLIIFLTIKCLFSRPRSRESSCSKIY